MLEASYTPTPENSNITALPIKAPRESGFVIVPAGLARLEGRLDPQDKRGDIPAAALIGIYTIMRGMTDQHNIAYMSNATLAARTGYERRYLSRALSVLARLGAIVQLPTPNGVATKYTFPADLRPTAPASLSLPAAHSPTPAADSPSLCVSPGAHSPTSKTVQDKKEKDREVREVIEQPPKRTPPPSSLSAARKRVPPPTNPYLTPNYDPQHPDPELDLKITLNDHRTTTAAGVTTNTLVPTLNSAKDGDLFYRAVHHLVWDEFTHAPRSDEDIARALRADWQSTHPRHYGNPLPNGMPVTGWLMKHARVQEAAIAHRVARPQVRKMIEKFRVHPATQELRGDALLTRLVAWLSHEPAMPASQLPGATTPTYIV